MSARSKNSDVDLARPFADDVVAEARRLAEAYQIVLTEEDGEWYGGGLEMPNVMADGPAPADCIAATRDALTAAIATMMELGQRPPAPAAKGKRDKQVNIRVTTREKTAMETAARTAGFQDVSAFVRASAIDAVRKFGVSIEMKIAPDDGKGHISQVPLPRRRATRSRSAKAKK